MAKYRKRAIVIEAIQWHQYGDHPAVERRWKCSNPKCQAFYAEYVNGCPRCSGEVPSQNWSTYPVGAIQTLEGWHEVTAGDWIIRGIKGELYPCKPDIFDATYERVLHRVMVCGVDCRPGDGVCNNYCNEAPQKGPMAPAPPPGPDAGNE